MNTQLLEKFYRGECTPQEVKEVLNWFKSAEPGALQQQDILTIWEEANLHARDNKNAHDADATWANIINTIENRNTTPEESATASKEATVYSLTNWFGRNYYKVAATILLTLCFLGVLLYVLPGNNIQAAPLVTIEALPGVKKTITLEDGSIVTLNSGSQITFPAHFPADKREIELQGEAFFEVAKDSTRPFSVKACNISTQALGTSFNIRSQPKDSTISVALVTGLVKIEKQNQQQFCQLARLEPGQQLVYNKAKKQHRLVTFDTQEVITWKEGKLVFRKANLDQVIRKLENWYGVKIEIAGELPTEQGEWHYTGEYNRENIESVLEGISFVKHFSYKRKSNNTIIISFNNHSL